MFRVTAPSSDPAWIGLERCYNYVERIFRYMTKGKVINLSQPKTLYISDLDGTLSNQHVELSEFTAEAINKLNAMGVDFSIATARTPASVTTIMRNVKLGAPMILLNGVLTFDQRNQRVLHAETIGAQAAQAIVERFREHNQPCFLYSLKDGRFATYYETLDSEPLRQFAEERIKRYGKRFTQIASLLSMADANMVYLVARDSKERLQPIYNQLERISDIGCEFYKDVYREESWYLECHSAAASKKNALHRLRKEYGYDRVVCYGDNMNDLPLFEAADEKCAVKNAMEALKAEADHIVDSNVRDGVAHDLLNRLTTVYFICFTESEYTRREEMGLPPTPASKQVMNDLVDKMKGLGIVQIYSGPYPQTIESVGPLAKALSLPINLTNDFSERQADGVLMEDFRCLSEHRGSDLFHELDYGECLREVQDRNIRSLAQMIKSNRGQIITIGTHSTTLSTIIHHFKPELGHEELRRNASILPWIVRMRFMDERMVKIEELSL